jgi:hypothetical protein
MATRAERDRHPMPIDERWQRTDEHGAAGEGSA